MLELGLRGNKPYWAWITGLLLLIGLGSYFYSLQLRFGLSVTGMGRDISWGLYTAQMNFLVGVAAGGVMLVLPYYIHNYKAFGKIVILGEFLAVSALIMCLLFLLIHLGKPSRLMNVFLYPTPNAMVFWDAMIISFYLVINMVLGWTILEAERKMLPPPTWTRPLIYISVPVAFGIHTVTAFLYAGLPGRGFWLTAVLAPRFLASAFSSGPALLIFLVFVLKKLSGFDPGKKAIQTLSLIIMYALLANLFFLLCEVFVAFYSNIPEHKAHLVFLYAGHEGNTSMVPLMWLSLILLIGSAISLVVPVTRKNEKILIITCVALFLGTMIDKGIGFMLGGFTPNAFHQYVKYAPTLPEIAITVGIYAIGILILSIFYKIATSVKMANA